MNNDEESIVAYVFIGWLDMWFMPLFFLLFGVASWYALRSRNNANHDFHREDRKEREGFAKEHQRERPCESARSLR
ncbi:MAG: hypothetical protein R2911_32650 [Caldilineaceae bacterium]